MISRDHLVEALCKRWWGDGDCEIFQKQRSENNKKVKDPSLQPIIEQLYQQIINGSWDGFK